MQQPQADVLTELLAAGGSSTQLPAGTQAASGLAQARQLVLQHGQEALLASVQQHVHSASPALFKVCLAASASCRQAVCLHLRSQPPPSPTHARAQALKTVLLATRSSSLPAATGADAPPASDLAACVVLRSALAAQLPSWVSSCSAEDGQYAADLVAAFTPELEHLPSADLVSTISAALAAMEAHTPHCCCLLELLPPCLSALSATAPDGGGDDADEEGAAAADAEADEDGTAAAAAAAASSAAKHRDAAIHRLQHCQWRADSVCQVLTVLKGLPMTREQLKAMVTKALRAARCGVCRWLGCEPGWRVCLLACEPHGVLLLLLLLLLPAAPCRCRCARTMRNSQDCGAADAAADPVPAAAAVHGAAWHAHVHAAGDRELLRAAGE
jgi:hypothetical protein